MLGGFQIAVEFEKLGEKGEDEGERYLYDVSDWYSSSLRKDFTRSKSKEMNMTCSICFLLAGDTDDADIPQDYEDRNGTTGQYSIAVRMSIPTGQSRFLYNARDDSFASIE